MVESARIEYRDDGTILGYDPGFGPEVAAAVLARRNPDGSLTILWSRTWNPATEKPPAFVHPEGSSR